MTENDLFDKIDVLLEPYFEKMYDYVYNLKIKDTDELLHVLGSHMKSDIRDIIIEGLKNEKI